MSEERPQYQYQTGASPAVVPTPAPATETPIEDQTAPGQLFSFDQRLDYLERKLGLHVRDEQPQPEPAPLPPGVATEDAAAFNAWKAAQSGTA